MKYKLGYLIEQEDHDWLSQQEDPEVFLRTARSSFPDFNPYAEPYTPVEDQGSLSSCAGNSLALMFQIALVQRYGIQAKFSRMGCYITAQRQNGIKTDSGSTISGCQKAAAEGACLEKYYPYPSRYSNQIPSTANGKFVFKLKGSRQIKDVDLMYDLVMAGVPIQTGLSWGSSCEKSICDSYTGGRGGHSTAITGIDEKTGHFVHQNSWSERWADSGRNLWTKKFVSDVFRKDRYCTFAAYDAAGFEAPQESLQEI